MKIGQGFVDYGFPERSSGCWEAGYSHDLIGQVANAIAVGETVDNDKGFLRSVDTVQNEIDFGVLEAFVVWWDGKFERLGEKRGWHFCGDQIGRQLNIDRPRLHDAFSQGVVDLRCSGRGVCEICLGHCDLGCHLGK